MLPISTPIAQYSDLEGFPLQNGYLYFGVANQNPVTSPITVFWDAAGTQPAAQPIRTIGGYASRNGTPANVYSYANYSLLVKKSNGVQVFYGRDSSQFDSAIALNNSFSGQSGSSLIGFIQSGVGAIARKVQDELRERPINIKQFGAVGDWNGTTGTDNSDAFDAAITLAVLTGRSIFVPTGSYRITRPIIMNTGAYTRGIIIFGEGLNSSIIQTGAGQDAIYFSTTQFLQNSGLRDLSITCAVTAGHCINIVYGCTTCFVSNVEMAALNPVKSCVYGDWTSFGGGVFDTKFSGGSWYQNPASTVGGFVIRAKGTIFNENMFENLRCYQANTIQFFDIQTVVDPNIWLVNNSWKNINFEVCKGGGIKFSSFKSCKFENITFWDAGGNYINNLIDMIAGTGYESIANTFINVTRNGDDLAASVRDIRILSGQDTVLVNCYTATGDNPSYDFNLKRVIVMGRMFNVLNDANTTTILPESTTTKGAVISTAFVDELHLGGTSYSDSATITYSGGFVQVTPTLASSGVILTAQTAGLSQRKIVWDGTELYPLLDNNASLGLGANRWSVVYAATGAINTSDENSKDIRSGGIDPAVLRAWAKVQFYQYKFRDAIALKGDGARWHVGVVAQRVKEAFESEGLDAFAYGVLCYDEWPNAAPVIGEDGTEVLPAVTAGSRYGIRYDEAWILECAYLRSKIS